MSAEPNPNLAAAILARMGDLGTFMHQRDLVASVASGTTPAGIPITVVVAIDWAAVTLKDVGTKVVERVAEERDRDGERAARN